MKARFFTSALDNLPDLGMPEIAIVGRSNVGKSSLVNHLFNHKHLAKVSAQPGKTQTLNFFIVNEAFALVDLPGYGFAKRSHEIQHKWAASIENYFGIRKTLSLILLLVDSRRLPGEEEIAMVEWAKHFEKPVLIIFTKSDTLTEHERIKNTENSLKILNQADFIYYTIKDSSSRKVLIQKLKTYGLIE